MSLIVRNKKTGCYLQGPGQWTNHLDAALQFNSGLKLVDYLEHGGCREKPDSVEVVVIQRTPEQSSGASAA